MKSVVIGVVAVVWVATLIGLSGWLWLRSRRTSLDEKRAQARRRVERDRRRPERDLERVMREATSAGAVVVVERRGSDPTRVRWSDGSVWFYFPDQDRFLAARDRGMAPLGTSWVGPAPALGSPRAEGDPDLQG